MCNSLLQMWLYCIVSCHVFIAKWHVTLRVFRHCLKIIIYNRLLLTNTENVSRTKHNLI